MELLSAHPPAQPRKWISNHCDIYIEKDIFTFVWEPDDAVRRAERWLIASLDNFTFSANRGSHVIRIQEKHTLAIEERN